MGAVHVVAVWLYPGLRQAVKRGKKKCIKYGVFFFFFFFFYIHLTPHSPTGMAGD